MESDGLFAANSIVWPLSFLLVALTLLRHLREEVNPIFKGMVGTLAQQSSSNAVAWALGMMIGTLGSLQALAEVADKMHWPYISALAKILQPGLAAVLGYIMASPAQKTPSIINPPA